jgi:hypothetical protein
MIHELANAEIVGFDGSPLGEGGRVVVVVRNRASQLCYKLVPDLIDGDEVVDTVPYARMEALGEEQAVTLVPEPVPAFAGAVALYVKEELLEAVGQKLPPAIWKASRRRWQTLPDGTFVTFMTEEASEELVDHWATLITERANSFLRRFLATGNSALCRRAERLADLALFVAEGSDIRYGIFLSLGLALLYSAVPSRLENLYEFEVVEEFPEFTMDDFKKELLRTGADLRDAATLENQEPHLMRRTRRRGRNPLGVVRRTSIPEGNSKSDESAHEPNAEVQLSRQQEQQIWAWGFDPWGALSSDSHEMDAIVPVPKEINQLLSEHPFLINTKFFRTSGGKSKRYQLDVDKLRAYEEQFPEKIQELGPVITLFLKGLKDRNTVRRIALRASDSAQMKLNQEEHDLLKLDPLLSQFLQGPSSPVSSTTGQKANEEAGTHYQLELMGFATEVIKMGSGKNKDAPSLLARKLFEKVQSLNPELARG